MTASSLTYSVTLAVATTYRIEHRVASTRASDGFGLAVGFGINEIYTQVAIHRI